MSEPDSPAAATLARTPLHALHRELGAKMVPFAGYDMPVSYPAGILAEHRACRESAALFDVSHMGQVFVSGNDAASALESMLPVDLIGLAVGRQRYAFFTNDAGGILDDLMATRRDDAAFTGFHVVVNAGNKDDDLARMQAAIGARCRIEPRFDRALLALQGPRAIDVLKRLAPALASLTFMSGSTATIAGIDVYATRSGYTGEDGWEISVAADDAERLARALLAEPEVSAAGLGARDTLRLEAGLCLHGHDIDAATTPVEAALTWAIQKVRRADGARAGGYPGAAVIDRQLAAGATRKRVGLVGDERAPVREGASLHAGDDADAGAVMGRVTSGTLAPTLGKPVAMAYVDAAHAAVGTLLHADVRGRRLPMHVSPMPFVPHRYFRG